MSTENPIPNKQATPKPEVPARTVLKLTLKDVAALHSSYMPFVRGGAIFVPTTTQHTFGDEIIVSMHLQSSDKKLAIPGKVMWIAPESCERGTQGIGIQFIGTTKAKVKLIIETMLGNRANVPPLVRTY
jgi:type IV pilus assembly protein PilZ